MLGSSSPLTGVVEETIDALVFLPSHEVDTNFSALPKETAESIRVLQREQRERVQHRFGALQPSPDYLQSELEAAYRCELDRLAACKKQESNPSTVLAGLTVTQRAALKRGMKHHIHEWEFSTRKATGRDVTTENKYVVRSVYELYKLSKPADGAADAPTAGPAHSPTAAGRSSSGAGERGVEPTSSASNHSRGTTGSRRSSDGPRRTSTGSSSLSRQKAFVSEVRSEIVECLEQHHLGQTPVTQLSNDALTLEKKEYKRLLYDFESKYTTQFGHPPEVHLRTALEEQYGRYKTLRNELVARGLAPQRPRASDSSAA